MTLAQLLILLLLHLPAAFEPAHLKEIAPVPPNFNVVTPTWVIADLSIGIDGRVYLPTVLKGGEPLLGTALSSVSRWMFEPARTNVPVDSHVTAIFLFRARGLFSAPPPDLSDISVVGTDTPPIPVSVSDPGYPPTSVAEGEVVLELRISETGSIGPVSLIKDTPGLSAFTEDAVRRWKFSPATRSGQPVPGTVVAVVSYLRPVVS